MYEYEYYLYIIIVYGPTGSEDEKSVINKWTSDECVLFLCIVLDVYNYISYESI